MPLVFVLAQCGGSSSSDVGGGSDDGGSDGAPLDGTAGDAAGDGASSDAGSDGFGGGDSGDDEQDSGADTGGDAAVGCADAGATRADCVSCCENAHPQGAQTFESSEIACACTAALCGADDAGVTTGDAGDFGTGACTAECAMPGHTVGAACNACLRHSVGTPTDHGPCYDRVEAACEADNACKAYAECVLTCPAN